MFPGWMVVLVGKLLIFAAASKKTKRRLSGLFWGL